MRQIVSVFFVIALSVVANEFCLYAQSNYVPAADSWQKRSPQQAKFDAVKLKEAIDFAVASEAFFEEPALFARELPALYRALSDAYRLDPATW